MNKHKRKLLSLNIAKYITLYSPLLFLIIYNHETYFTMETGLSVSFGFVIVIITAIVMTKKETNIFNGSIYGYLIVLAVAYLMRSILDELWLILLFATIGKIISLIFEPGIEKETQVCNKLKDNEINTLVNETLQETKTNEIENKESITNGRV